MPDVNIWAERLASAIWPKSQRSSCMSIVHVCSCNHMHWGEPCHWLIYIYNTCRCPEQLLISCSNGSFLECSPPTAEARVRFLARTCQFRDIQFRTEMTLVNFLHNIFTQSLSHRLRHITLFRRQRNLTKIMRFSLPQNKHPGIFAGSQAGREGIQQCPSGMQPIKISFQLPRIRQLYFLKEQQHKIILPNICPVLNLLNSVLEIGNLLILIL